MKWSKLLANLVGNATSAILDLGPGAIYADSAGTRSSGASSGRRSRSCGRSGCGPWPSPGADVSLLLRGLALPAAIGRPIVARAIAGARGGKSPVAPAPRPRRRHRAPPRPAGSTARSPRRRARPASPTPVNAALAALVDEVAADPERAAWFARPTRRGSPRRSPLGRRRPPGLTGDGPILGRRGPLRARPRDPDRRGRLRHRRHPVERHRRAAHRAAPTRGRSAAGGPAARTRCGPWARGSRCCRGSSTCSRAPPRCSSRARWAPGVEVEVVAGLAAIIGHSRSPFLGFGGGRGVAPAFGGLLAFPPARRRGRSSRCSWA